ncbi:hypothetical protein LP7551_04491 [Roseibium album]|nr:hypothetical protein LP7551_04491 [Roseibium album]
MIVSCRTEAPPSLVVVEEDTSLVLEFTSALSKASTLTEPRTSTLVEPPLTRSSTKALVFVLTLLDARIALTLIPVAPKRADASETAALLTVEFSLDWFSALTVRLPVASKVESSIDATVFAGCSLPISVSPKSASIALKRMFWDAQPTVLNASTTPTAVSPVEVELLSVASMPEELTAVTETLPPTAVVSSPISLFEIFASVEL